MRVGQRLHESAEEITFVAHEGKCRYCRSVVKMRARANGTLIPDFCYCFHCGQQYYVVIPADMTIDEWADEQWAQKMARP